MDSLFNVGDRVKVLDGSRASVANVKDRYGHILEVADVFPGKLQPHLNIDFGEFTAWVPVGDVKLIERAK